MENTVFWFEISMNNPPGMNELYAGHNLDKNIPNCGLVQKHLRIRIVVLPKETVQISIT